jgi:Ulp1 family protease
MSHCRDNEMLVVPFNTGNHWVLLSISTMYDQIWYFDSSKLVDSKTSDQLNHDFSDVMSVLDE